MAEGEVKLVGSNLLPVGFCSVISGKIISGKTLHYVIYIMGWLDRMEDINTALIYVCH